MYDDNEQFGEIPFDPLEQRLALLIPLAQTADGVQDKEAKRMLKDAMEIVLARARATTAEVSGNLIFLNKKTSEKL